MKKRKGYIKVGKEVTALTPSSMKKLLKHLGYKAMRARTVFSRTIKDHKDQEVEQSVHWGQKYGNQERTLEKLAANQLVATGWPFPSIALYELAIELESGTVEPKKPIGPHGDWLDVDGPGEANLVDGHEQSLWFRVGMAFKGDKPMKRLVLWIDYQRKYMGSATTGGLLVSRETWRRLNKVVEAGFEKRKPKRR